MKIFSTVLVAFGSIYFFTYTVRALSVYQAYASVSLTDTTLVGSYTTTALFGLVVLSIGLLSLLFSKR